MRRNRSIAKTISAWIGTLGAFSILAAAVIAGLLFGAFVLVRLLLGFVFGHDS